MTRWILLMSLWLWAAPAAAPAAAQGADAAREADHTQLRALLAEATAAVNRLDAPALAGLMAPGFVAVLADQTPITDAAGFNTYFNRYFRAEGAPLAAVELKPEAAIPTRFIAENVGVVYGRSSDRYTLRRGGDITFDSTWSATVVKLDGRWRVQSFHAGVDMTDNALLAAARRGAWLWGAGGLALGLIAGFLLRRLTRR